MDQPDQPSAFFNYQYKFHGGYDQVERMFTSIPRQFCLSPEAVCEFSPEPFCCEEMFENENKIMLPDGNILQLELPKWAPTPLYFVELHRAALECPLVRGQINKWIDLMFGYKLSGQAAIDSMNLYNPMGYHDPHPTAQNNEMRDQWISSCGQMSDQLFDEPCPVYSAITTLDSTSITFDVNPAEIESKFQLHTDSCLLAADKAKLYDERFSTSLHFCVSARERFCAVTSSASLVIVVHVKTTDSKVSLFKHQAVFARSNPRFSVAGSREITEFVKTEAGFRMSLIESHVLLM